MTFLIEISPCILPMYHVSSSVGVIITLFCSDFTDTAVKPTSRPYHLLPGNPEEGELRPQLLDRFGMHALIRPGTRFWCCLRQHTTTTIITTTISTTTTTTTSAIPTSLSAVVVVLVVSVLVVVGVLAALSLFLECVRLDEVATASISEARTERDPELRVKIVVPGRHCTSISSSLDTCSWGLRILQISFWMCERAVRADADFFGFDAFQVYLGAARNGA